VLRIKELIARLLPNRWRSQRSSSIVLLLREANSPSEDVLRLAAERAWGISFSNSSHFVMQSGDGAIMSITPYMFNVLSAPQPYLGRDPREHAKPLPESSQQKAWSEHSAWLAIDCINGSPDAELEYCVLSKLAAEMLNLNCTGIYVPGVPSFIPNDGSRYRDLQKVAASRDPGII
jgi:hypothetical protein